jgi:hypothetical protein
LLKNQKSKLNFDFTKIIASKRARIDVEVYKRMFAKIREKKKRKQTGNKKR